MKLKDKKMRWKDARELLLHELIKIIQTICGIEIRV